MLFSRRSALVCSFSAVLAASLPVAGCTRVSGVARANNIVKTRVTVLGAIHSTHRTSTLYSLDVLRAAIRRAQPDVILTEIPPDRIAEAKRGFAETGRVTEARTSVFPEYTDVVFPLSREIPFEIEPAAGWTREIAVNRSAALKRIEEDPARAEQWAEHLAARRQYRQDIGNRGDDPLFIHTSEYDALVEKAQTPYQRYFDADLGPGGWSQINDAHNSLINVGLDRVSGQGKRVLVTFGSWHKYKILRSLSGRSDIEFADARELFV